MASAGGATAAKAAGKAADGATPPPRRAHRLRQKKQAKDADRDACVRAQTDENWSPSSLAMVVKKNRSWWISDASVRR